MSNENTALLKIANKVAKMGLGVDADTLTPDELADVVVELLERARRAQLQAEMVCRDVEALKVHVREVVGSKSPAN